MATFSHLDPGTDESVWRDDPRIGRLPALDGSVDELVVVAAHPDDETLGAGGLMRAVHRRGGRVTVVVATDGEGSHPGSHTHSPTDLARIRRAEVREAVGLVAPNSAIHFLGREDGALRDDIDGLTAALAGVVDALDLVPDARTLVVAPWSGDGHPDHRAAAEAAARVCRGRRIVGLGYPIWLWHWGRGDDLPWAEAVRFDLSADDREAKLGAIALHRSQLAPLSPASGDEAIVHAAMRSHFERDAEIFLREGAAEPAGSMSGEWFEDFYRRNADPWGFETRWYERRKRSILLAALPDESLGVVLELGCATGLITQDLAERADRVVALDPAQTALDAAISRLGTGGVVEFVQGRIPQDWPGGRYETIVLSEVGYYLDDADLAETIRLALRDLTEGGCFVACHWRHPVPEYPRSGDDVHAVLAAEPGWEAIVRHEERDFVLEVFCRRPARSVAEREGLV